jgi:SAM-dependent methyltransferase
MSEPSVPACEPCDGALAPSSWVKRWSHLVAQGGAVLDVAAGSGRHSRWFAARGHRVTALDRDAAALAMLADAKGVETVTADLEGGSPWPLPAKVRFAAVIVTNYLHRPLFARLIDTLAPGGVLICETFAAGNETVGKPSNPAFLLAPGELLDVVRPHLRVVAFQDGFLATPRAAFVQRICAVREAVSPMRRSNGAVIPPRYDLAG